MADSQEYKKVFDTRYTNDGNVSPFKGSADTYTDWWKECINDVAVQQNYDLSFSGGNDKMIYSGSIGYYKQDSQYKVGQWQKLSARFSTEYNFNKIVKAGVDFTPRYEQWDDTPGLMSAIMAMDPTTPVMRPKANGPAIHTATMTVRTTTRNGTQWLLWHVWTLVLANMDCSQLHT